MSSYQRSNPYHQKPDLNALMRLKLLNLDTPFPTRQTLSSLHLSQINHPRLCNRTGTLEEEHSLYTNKLCNPILNNSSESLLGSGQCPMLAPHPDSNQTVFDLIAAYVFKKKDLEAVTPLQAITPNATIFRFEPKNLFQFLQRVFTLSLDTPDDEPPPHAHYPFIEYLACEVYYLKQEINGLLQKLKSTNDRNTYLDEDNMNLKLREEHLVRELKEERRISDHSQRRLAALHDPNPFSLKPACPSYSVEQAKKYSELAKELDLTKRNLRITLNKLEKTRQKRKSDRRRSKKDISYLNAKLNACQLEVQSNSALSTPGAIAGTSSRKTVIADQKAVCESHNYFSGAHDLIMTDPPKIKRLDHADIPSSPSMDSLSSSDSHDTITAISLKPSEHETQTRICVLDNDLSPPNPNPDVHPEFQTYSARISIPSRSDLIHTGPKLMTSQHGTNETLDLNSLDGELTKFKPTACSPQLTTSRVGSNMILSPRFVSAMICGRKEVDPENVSHTGNSCFLSSILAESFPALAYFPNYRSAVS